VSQHGPWFRSEDAGCVLAFAERCGFVREPTLPGDYDEFLVIDALEALTWLHERELLSLVRAVCSEADQAQARAS